MTGLHPAITLCFPAAAPKEQLLELRRACTPVEEAGVVDRVAEETAKQVGSQALGRVISHLDAILENRDGEMW